MRVDFYHLTRAPASQVLPALAEKLSGEGTRFLIVAEGTALPSLSEALWAHKPASFLAHAIASGEAEDADEPVLLSPVVDPVNRATALVFADGQWRDVPAGMDRVFHLFDESHIADARIAWKMLGSKDGVERHYWKQDERGKWREGP